MIVNIVLAITKLTKITIGIIIKNSEMLKSVPDCLKTKRNV